MSILRFLFSILIIQLHSAIIQAQQASITYNEPHRPRMHFSPKEKWMNDPNGMVYHKGVYHLFYQYYPDSTVWGPMHWGHAVSKNMVKWKHRPIALFPDSLGYIFSGSAVVDVSNTSGFGKNSKAPLVAIFTHHDPKGEKEKRNDFQYQSLAYSNDDGKTWIKYAGNPVLKNPGITDFRDPKVIWFENDKKWIMTLAVKDRIFFYSSPNLKDWAKESEFGENSGAHGGVWECPDLFSMEYDGKAVWILIVNINPGGPNKGSATQYFLGDFDGKTFLPSDTKTRWLDYGPDEYAGVTWSNTGDRKVFLGWMSNWQYAQMVPTERWRSAMTVPRELKIAKTRDGLLVASLPVEELSKIKSKPVILNDIRLSKEFSAPEKIKSINIPCIVNLSLDEIKNFSIKLSNQSGDELLIGYDKLQNNYFIDRTKSGITNFGEGFAAKHFAPRFTGNSKMNISLVIDVSSVELFADDGLTVMTEIFFPHSPYNQISFQSVDSTLLKRLEYIRLRNIWQ
ncbi:MAG TPA: glycoside hydrolase family 32 protein [Chitinophagaceae bacterium]